MGAGGGMVSGVVVFSRVVQEVVMDMFVDICKTNGGL
jgi:hypothetical protein